MHTERRRNRTDNRFEAFTMYLGALAERSQSEQIVVADEDGLLVAGIGDTEHLETLAAFGAAAEADGPVHSTLLPTPSGDFRLTSVGGARPSSAEATAAFSRLLL